MEMLELQKNISHGNFFEMYPPRLQFQQFLICKFSGFPLSPLHKMYIYYPV